MSRAVLSMPDHRLMVRCNRWHAPHWFRSWMLLATRAGDGWLWAAIGFAILLSSSPNRFRAVAIAAISVVWGIGVFHCMKRLVCRTRPCDIEPHCWAQLTTKDHFSFPSGHSTTAFAVAVSLGNFYPELLPLLVLLALNVAASRVMLGMHFLSDVIAGSAIGSTLAVVAYRFAS